MSKDKYLHARVVNDSRFLIPMGLVREVLAGPKVARLPYVGDEVLGLISIAGSVIPLFDFSQLVGGPKIIMTPKKIALILSNNDNQISILVEEVILSMSYGLSFNQSNKVTSKSDNLNKLHTLSSVSIKDIPVLDFDLLLAKRDDCLGALRAS